MRWLPHNGFTYKACPLGGVSDSLRSSTSPASQSQNHLKMSLDHISSFYGLALIGLRLLLTAILVSMMFLVIESKASCCCHSNLCILTVYVITSLLEIIRRIPAVVCRFPVHSLITGGCQNAHPHKCKSVTCQMDALYRFHIPNCYFH